MLTILRVLFTGGFAYVLWQAGKTGPGAGDMAVVYYMPVALAFALATGIVWAPAVGAMVCAPLDATFTSGSFIVEEHKALRLVYWLIRKKRRRLAVFFCFIEAINHPDWPTAYNIGLKLARPGSWLEKVFAREVWRFDNLQNAIAAHAALRRHGIEPPEHSNPQVNWQLSMADRKETPTKDPIAVPAAPPPPLLRRNAKIKLFQGEAATGDDEGISTERTGPPTLPIESAAVDSNALASPAAPRRTSDSGFTGSDTSAKSAAGRGFFGWLRRLVPRPRD